MDTRQPEDNDGSRDPHSIMTVLVIHIRGVNCTCMKAIDAPFSSRFADPTKKYVRHKTDSISDEL
jgi:hypothetical protein